MARAIAICNQKGGVGKTTTAVNLAYGLALRGHKVLLIDLDPQANATSGLGVEKPKGRAAYRVLDRTSELDSIPVQIRGADDPGGLVLSIVPTSASLSEIERAPWQDESERYLQLRRALDHYRQGFDFVLCDCPPTLGFFTLNALTSCDSALLPIQCEYFAMEGLSQVLEAIKEVRRKYNRKLEVDGIVLTMYQDDEALAREVAAEVRSYFREKVYRTAVPRDMSLSEASSRGEPILIYAPGSRAAWAYIQLIKEMLAHEREKARTGA